MLMKTIINRLLQLVFFLCLSQSAVGQTLHNPIGIPSGRAASIGTDQFLAARFSLTTPQTLASVGGEFQNLSGSFFAALVPLSSITALPIGDPSAGIPFNPGEVLAYRSFEANVGMTAAVITTPFSIDLPAGVYGVVFGTGLYGTEGNVGANGGMPMYGRVQGSSSFFWSSVPWRWQDSELIPEEEFNIMVTVPEPSSAVLLAIGVCGLVLRHEYRRRLLLGV
jgi:hypothetical protein